MAIALFIQKSVWSNYFDSLLCDCCFGRPKSFNKHLSSSGSIGLNRPTFWLIRFCFRRWEKCKNLTKSLENLCFNYILFIYFQNRSLFGAASFSGQLFQHEFYNCSRRIKNNPSFPNFFL